MATKFANVEEAKDFIASTKEELKTAKGELKELRKSLGLKGDATPENPKDAKKVEKLSSLIEKKEKAIEEAQAWLKENKPKKSKEPRALKYDYPEDCTTADQKKKFRQEQRAAAKRAEKAAAKGEKAEKGESKKDKKAKAAAEEEPSKKDKKKKDKKKSSDED